LPNRIFLHKRFQQQVGVAGGAVNSGSALLLLDLDHFKDVNDTLGHHVGDDILIQTGMRLREVGEQYKALVCRLGGDEFALLMYTFGNRARVDELARELGDSLRQPFNVEGYEIRVGVSIGIACYPDDGEDSHSLMRAADVAMYQAKRLPQVSVRYDSKFDQYSTERLALANELVQAVQEMQLVMHYQPKVDVANGETVGLEALVRWQHPRLGLLYPGSFIDLVEVGEVVQSFTNAVIRLAVADKKRLHDLGFNQPVSINLSTRNLLDTACLTTFDQVIAEHQLPAWELEVELTETVLMQDPTLAAKLLGRFNDRGIKAVVDDFGTGYSSLAYLRMLPIAALKIDRSFVTDMVTNQQDQTIVRSTIGLAHNLGLSVVAEGVEDADTMSMLRGMQCDLAQGFGLCKPLPLEKLIPWLQEHSRGDAQTRVSDAS
jgi:diguanylate cyclase (GGDEF)-like protein